MGIVQTTQNNNDKSNDHLVSFIENVSWELSTGHKPYQWRAGGYLLGGHFRRLRKLAPP